MPDATGEVSLNAGSARLLNKLQADSSVCAPPCDPTRLSLLYPRARWSRLLDPPCFSRAQLQA